VVDVVPFAVVFVNPFRAISDGTRISIWDVNPEGSQWDVMDTGDSASVRVSHLLPRGVVGVKILSFRRIGQLVSEDRRLVVVQVCGDPIGVETSLVGRARAVTFPARNRGWSGRRRSVLRGSGGSRVTIRSFEIVVVFGRRMYALSFW